MRKAFWFGVVVAALVCAFTYLAGMATGIHAGRQHAQAAFGVDDIELVTLEQWAPEDQRTGDLAEQEFFLLLQGKDQSGLDGIANLTVEYGIHRKSKKPYLVVSAHRCDGRVVQMLISVRAVAEVARDSEMFLEKGEEAGVRYAAEIAFHYLWLKANPREVS